jgi:4-methyl-5(b-hydroxyethyl)-thiazole monophosphate biosynthesis
MVTVFLAEGFEEIEAITPVDILRRGGVPVTLCSISDSLTVTGSHGISILCDTCLSQWKGEEDMIVLPGGMPGTLHLKNCAPLRLRIAEHRKKGYLAAICAAPTVFGAMRILGKKKATCYPGMEDQLHAASYETDDVVVDENLITSRGAGTAFAFGLQLLALLKGEEVAEDVAKAMCYSGEKR